jgi:citrate lyase subunit beta / citryl-CoA lyase
VAHRVFSPGADEVAQTRRLVAAYQAALARGVGTIDFEGRMIDGPLLKRAERIVALAERLGAGAGP